MTRTLCRRSNSDQRAGHRAGCGLQTGELDPAAHLSSQLSLAIPNDGEDRIHQPDVVERLSEVRGEARVLQLPRVKVLPRDGDERSVIPFLPRLIQQTKPVAAPKPHVS